jgi:SOS-response transcriptional repressor LexA
MGAVLKQARVAKKLSVSEVANRSGVSRAMIDEIEKGKNVSVDTVEKIASALGVREIPLGNGRLQISDAAAIHVRDLARRIADEAQEIVNAVGQRRLSSNVVDFPDDDAALTLAGIPVSERQKIVAANARENRASRPSNHGVGDLSYFVPPGKTTADLPFDDPQIRADVVEFPLRGYVAAGRPIEDATDGETVLIPRAFVADDEYILRARGDSMTEWGIVDGTYVIVQPSRIAATGQLIIAWYNGGITIKQWYYKRGRRALIAGNADFPTYEITDADDFEIRAIVTGIWNPTSQVVGSKKVPRDRRPREKR